MLNPMTQAYGANAIRVRAAAVFRPSANENLVNSFKLECVQKCRQAERVLFLTLRRPSLTFSGIDANLLDIF